MTNLTTASREYALSLDAQCPPSPTESFEAGWEAALPEFERLQLPRPALMQDDRQREVYVFWPSEWDEFTRRFEQMRQSTQKSRERCPDCHGQWYSRNGPTGAQETCKHPWHGTNTPK